MAFEEVDHLSRDSGPRPRPNFGWPRREGFANSGLGLECGKRNAFTDPIWTYPNPGDAVTVIVGPRYRGTPGSEFSFPAEYEGSLFVMDFFHGWIRRLVQTATGWELAAPVEGQPSSENWGASFLFYSDFQLGPDGALYLARLIPRPSRPSGIYRVVPSVADRSIASAASSSDVRAGPNPVVGSSGTDIRWEVVHPGPHTLAIHDAAGRRLRVVEISLLSRGPASVRWDGRTGRGDPAPAGVYFYSVRDAAGQQRGGKLLLLR
jgi:hypothetical protein